MKTTFHKGDVVRHGTYPYLFTVLSAGQWCEIASDDGQHNAVVQSEYLTLIRRASEKEFPECLQQLADAPEGKHYVATDQWEDSHLVTNGIEWIPTRYCLQNPEFELRYFVKLVDNEPYSPPVSQGLPQEDKFQYFYDGDSNWRYDPKSRSVWVLEADRKWEMYAVNIEPERFSRMERVDDPLVAMNELPRNQAREESIGILRARIATLEQQAKVKDDAIKKMIAREKQWAELAGHSDCCCIKLSREGEREYETGTCPHQLGLKALAAQPELKPDHA